MKKLWLPALLLTGWMFLLSSDIPVGENYLPAIGRFLSPFDGVWQNVTAEKSSFDLQGVTKDEVKILFDDRDIPHVYAHNIEDAIYAQGYVHAANRLFAMDISTRAAAGRLSELVGIRALAYDHQQRERGLEKSAQEKAKSWEQHGENKAIIDAYVRGVNDYIESLDYSEWPIEYKILSHAPVKWTPTHVALMVTNMAIMLCIAENDLEYSKAAAALSPEDFAYLYPSYNPLESPVIPFEKKWDFIPLKSDSTGTQNTPMVPAHSSDDKKRDLNGSNNWAVSASKTANGVPILANDPHLSLTLPNIWYEMEIHTPEISVHGASIPGIPYVVIGFNESIAWGTTNSGQDVLDWYRITWQDSSRHAYLLDGEYVQAELRPEVINVHGEPDIIDTVRYTFWGPVSSRGDHKDMAMKWIGHQRASANDLAYLQKINKARNLNDYRDAIEAFQYPAQNKVFASVDGDIAISVAGVMPLRNQGTGAYILDGDQKKYDWQGFIPFDHSPFIINPVRGFVSSANQIPTDQTYPYEVLGNRVFEDYRNRVINMVLDSADHLTVDDMKALQQNNFNLQAAEMLPLLFKALGDTTCISAEEKIYADQLRGWNYEMHRDSVSPILYTLWYGEFEKMLFDELDTMGLMHPEDWRVIEIVDRNEENKFFDLISTEKKETLNDIVCASFYSMVKTYLALDGEDRKDWGSYKATEIPHLARLGSFGVPYMHTSGAKHIVNAMGKSHGPSWRMIVELSKPPKAYVNYPGGQSGNPASPHFRDMLDQFFEGKYYEVTLRNDPSSWTPVKQINMHPQ
ncbi:MAG TPA: penicillin acylase family protein [Saprospiraceae bacterium]|nr:penicillin acylase family protein [Saprospiraceae bacterium]